MQRLLNHNKLNNSINSTSWINCYDVSGPSLGNPKWSDSSNWSSGSPNDMSVNVKFPELLSCQASNDGESKTITVDDLPLYVDGNFSIGSMIFEGVVTSYYLTGQKENFSLESSASILNLYDSITVVDSPIPNDASFQTIDLPIFLAGNEIKVSVGQWSTLVISGNISGNGGFTLGGYSSEDQNGRVIFHGNNSYAGPTVINCSVDMDSASANTDITINSGGFLQLNNTVNTSVHSLSLNGELFVGSGGLTIGSPTSSLDVVAQFAKGSQINLDLSEGNYLTINGSADIQNAILNVSLNLDNPNRLLPVLKATGSLTGSFKINVTQSGYGVDYKLIQVGNTLYIKWQFVTTTWVGGAGGNWGDDTKWLNNLPNPMHDHPQGSYYTALLKDQNNIANATINLVGSYAVGTLEIDTQNTSYTLTGGKLLVNNLSVEGIATFNTSVECNTIFINEGSELVIGDKGSISSDNLSVAGGGELSLNGPIQNANVINNEGAITFDAPDLLPVACDLINDGNLTILDSNTIHSITNRGSIEIASLEMLQITLGAVFQNSTITLAPSANTAAVKIGGALQLEMDYDKNHNPIVPNNTLILDASSMTPGIYPLFTAAGGITGIFQFDPNKNVVNKKSGYTYSISYAPNTISIVVAI